MHLFVGSANGFCPLSRWERVGVRVLWPGPKTPSPCDKTLAQKEREQTVPVKINLTVYQAFYLWQCCLNHVNVCTILRTHFYA